MNIFIPFRPRSCSILQEYTAQDFFSDLTVGLTVGGVAIPVAMAFAIALGV